MKSKLSEILLRFATSEMNEMGVQEGAISKNNQLFTLEQAEQAINAYIAEVIQQELETILDYDNPKGYINAKLKVVAEQRRKAGL